MKASFDILLESPLLFTKKPVKTIGQMLFEPLAGRDENCNHPHHVMIRHCPGEKCHEDDRWSVIFRVVVNHSDETRASFFRGKDKLLHSAERCVGTGF